MANTARNFKLKKIHLKLQLKFNIIINNKTKKQNRQKDYGLQMHQ